MQDFDWLEEAADSVERSRISVANLSLKSSDMTGNSPSTGL